MMKRSFPTLFRPARPLGGAAVLAGLAAAVLTAFSGAHAQTLLDDLLPQPAGTCTCAVMDPPNNCSAALAEPNRVAQAQRREIRAQCANDWREACEEQYGWQACAGAEAQQQLAAQCDAYAEEWWTQIAAPQISSMRSQCNAANADWINQCETVDRPASCATCNEMLDEIDALTQQISDAEAWMDAMRSGEAILTPEDETLMAQRLDDLQRWNRELVNKQDGYALLQDSEFCPRS